MQSRVVEHTLPRLPSDEAAEPPGELTLGLGSLSVSSQPDATTTTTIATNRMSVSWGQREVGCQMPTGAKTIKASSSSARNSAADLLPASR
jgi:hypothetical protein